MAESMQSLPERVNELEREYHTYKHRLTQLEALPPRVSDVENQVATLNVRLTHIESATGRIEEKQDQMSRLLSEHTTRSETRLSTAVKIIGLCCTALGAVAIVVAWLT